MTSGPSGRLVVRGEHAHGLQKRHLRGEVLAPVRHVNRRHGDLAEGYRDDAVFEIEGGMREGRGVRPALLADVEAHAGVAFSAVPVAPVAVDVAEPHRQLIDRRLDLLQAHHVGTLRSIHSSSCPWRARMPLTFQVAIFMFRTMLPPLARAERAGLHASALRPGLQFPKDSRIEFQPPIPKLQARQLLRFRRLEVGTWPLELWSALFSRRLNAIPGYGCTGSVIEDPREPPRYTRSVAFWYADACAFGMSTNVCGLRSTSGNHELCTCTITRWPRRNT